MQNKLSVILSSFNEKENIKKTIDILINNKDVYEIIVIDDNSNDGTVEILNQITNEKVNFILRKNTKGFASSFIYGLMLSKGNLICRFDVDMHEDIDYFISSLNKMSDCDAIIFSRYVKGGNDERSFLRKFSSYYLNLFCRILLSSKVRDYSSCTFIIKKEVLQDVQPINTRYANFIIEFVFDLIKKNKNIYEMPYVQKKLTELNSKSASNYYIFFKNGFLYFFTILKCMIFKKFTT